MNRALIILTATMCLFCANLVHAGCEDISNELLADNKCTQISTYRSIDVTDKPVLVVVLHGDSPFNNSGYQYRFAELVANMNANLISVGMLRPGYTDPSGRTSDGVKGDAIGDNYDEKRVTEIAQTYILCP